MIKLIQGNNIKGRSFEMTLGQVNIITGDNAEGKSAALDCITLPLLGYHPRLGKLNDRIFQLSSGPEMGAMVQLEDGRSNALVFRKDGDSVTKQIVADQIEMAPVVLDARAYFELTPAKRVDLVAGLVDLTGKGYSVDEVTAAIKNISLETNSAHSEAAIKQTVKRVTDLKAAKFQEWIEKAIAEIKSGLSVAKANKKRMTAVVTGLEQLKALDQAAETNAGNVERQLKAARAELEILQQENGALNGQIDKLEEQKARIASLKAVTKPDADVPGLKVKQAELRSKIEAQESKIARLDKSMTSIRAGLVDVTKRIAMEGAQIEGLRTAIADDEKELAAFLSHANCPTCLAKGTKWKIAYQKQAEKKLAEQRDKLTLLRDAQPSLAADKVKYQKSIDNYEEQRRTLNDLNGELSDIAGQIEEHADGQSAYDTAQSELAGIGAVTEIEELEAKLKTLEESITAKRGAISELDIKRNSIIAARGENKRSMQAIEEREKVETEIEVLEATANLLAEKQAAMVAAAFGPILLLANQLTSAIMPEPLQYRNNELGIERAGRWISHNTFSGAEEAVTYAGLCVSLAAASTERIVVMDELTRFIGPNKERLILRICELVASGRIRQFIGVDGPQPVYDRIANTMSASSINFIIHNI
jgi:hypothetical protein